MANKAAVVVAKEGIAAQLKTKKKNPVIISGSKQDPNDPNVIRGDKTGVWKGKKPKTSRAPWVTELLDGIKRLMAKRKKEAE